MLQSVEVKPSLIYFHQDTTIYFFLLLFKIQDSVYLPFYLIY